MVMESVQQTHFEYLVIGTGLRQSILAAALAKSGHSVLHVDEQPHYGEDEATLSLNELVHWANTRNTKGRGSVDLFFSGTGSAELPEELARSARHYNITVCPTIYPSVGPFITSLVRSGVAKYSAFRLIDTVALYQDGQLISAATTKEDIFKDKSLSLVEKRRLMKFVMAALAETTEDGATGADLPFSETLERKNSLTGRLKEMIMYAAALSADEDGSTIPAVTRLRKYMQSTGKYGKSPYLLGQYGGVGEIVQGFCRVSAVFGATYMLGRAIQNLVEATSNSPARVQFDKDEVYTADCVIRVDEKLDHYPRNFQHKAIITLSKPIRLQRPMQEASEKVEEEDIHPETTTCENALLIVPPRKLGETTPAQPTLALMAGEGSFSAPSGQYVLYLTSMAGEHLTLTAKDSLQPCLEALMKASSEPVANDDVIMSAYYTDPLPLPLVVSRSGTSHSTSRPADITAQAGVAEFCDTAVDEAHACYTYATGDSDLFIQAEQETDDIEDM